jgi:hypothetical protein
MVPGWFRVGIGFSAVNAAGIVVTLLRPDLAVPSASWTAIVGIAALSYVGYRQLRRPS